LSEQPVEPQRLKLEITESAVMRDFEVTLGLLNRLRRSAPACRWTISAPAIRRSRC
jgi:EAL domain-containing protein (putative c-di-GMP-specific phosphodiesterase class I)